MRAASADDVHEACRRSTGNGARTDSRLSSGPWTACRSSVLGRGAHPAWVVSSWRFDNELQRRHLRRPGLAGLCRVEGDHKASFGKYRRLDMFYVDNRSSSMDLIVVDTLPVIVRRVLPTLRRSSATTAPAPAGLCPLPGPAAVTP
jgi:hypothetical protein